MDYIGVMYLTNFIKSEVDDRKDTLSRIYERAVAESESFKELEELKQRLVFFNIGVGGALFKECNELLDDIYNSPERSRDILLRMKNLSKDIKSEESRSFKVLQEFGADGLCVVDKEVNENFGKAFNILAESFIYMLLITDGVAGIDGLKWNNNNSLNEKLSGLNDIIKRMSEEASDIFFWKINRVRDDSVIRFCEYRYQLEYISYDDYLMLSDTMNPMTDNLYMAESVDNEIPVQTAYVGMGHIVPCKSSESFRALSKRKIVNDDYFGQVMENIACDDKNLLELLENMSEGKMYVVSPRKACDLMNQFVNAREIHYRKSKKLCLFCGKSLAEGLVCKEHFDTRPIVEYQE